MRTPLTMLAVFLCATLPTLALDKEELATVRFEQRLGATIPLNASFEDETGMPVRLGSFFGQKPVILAFAYYDCPSLCGVVLNGLLESVRNLRPNAGQDFNIVVISIRPGEPAGAAAAKKQTYVGRYARPNATAGWHFLAGSPEGIHAVTEAAGFHYRYDAETRQYAHPSGIVVLTPRGTVSQYFLGIEYPSQEVHRALETAGKQRMGSLVDQLLLLCFHYNPSLAKYGAVITYTLRAAGCSTVLFLAVMIGRSLLREARGRKERDAT